MRKKHHAQRLIARAREIAATGRHNGWFWTAAELAEAGEPLAMQILGEEPIRSELERTCQAARRRVKEEGS